MGGCHSHVWSINIFDREFTLVLYNSEELDSLGVLLELNLSFSAVSVSTDILSYTRFVLVTFRVCWPGIPFPIVCFLYCLGKHGQRRRFYFAQLSLFWNLRIPSCQFFLSQNYIDVAEFWHYFVYIPGSGVEHFAKSHCYRFGNLKFQGSHHGTLYSVSLLHFTFSFNTWTCPFPTCTKFSDFFPSAQKNHRRTIVGQGWAPWDRPGYQCRPLECHDRQWIALESQYRHVQAQLPNPLVFITIAREYCFECFATFWWTIFWLNMNFWFYMA